MQKLLKKEILASASAALLAASSAAYAVSAVSALGTD